MQLPVLGLGRERNLELMPLFLTLPLEVSSWFFLFFKLVLT